MVVVQFNFCRVGKFSAVWHIEQCVSAQVRPQRRNNPPILTCIVEAATGPTEEDQPDKIQPKKNPGAVALGRLGGLKGGKARAEKLTPKKQSEIAKKAAATRWAKE